MSNWKYRLELKDLWKKKSEEKLTIQELAKEVANRIRKLYCYKKCIGKLDEIASNFESCNDVDEFDSILDDLYDWADTPLLTRLGQMQRKMCWVSTF